MKTELTNEEILRYSRHLPIPEVGLEGQKKLKNSSVLIIGTGGLGSPVALYLAAAGIGKIGIVDHDEVETSNLQRQIVHGSSVIGKAKVLSAKKRLQDLNPQIEIKAYNETFTSENAFRIAKAYDVIVDGTDNFPTRYLINDVCVFLGVPNVYGSIFRFDGQVCTFFAKEGPCYRCLFPEPPPPGLVPSCADGGVLGILPGTIGTIQATETIKLLLGIGSNLVGKLLLYNALDMSFDFVNLKKNPNCKICGQNPEIIKLIDYDEFCGFPHKQELELPMKDESLINPKELKWKLDQNENFILLDVREKYELEISSLKGSFHIPFGQLPQRLNELDDKQEIIIFCRTGVRSKKALDLLKGSGYKYVRHLEGGINSWAKNIEPDLPVY
jgi:molybdopterin/thiamine biosynthesis adenylyltransferase/rhodanese-related sulfurtransferase